MGQPTPESKDAKKQAFVKEMKNKIARQRGLPVEETVEDYSEEEDTTDSLPSHLFWVWDAFTTLSRTRVVNQTGPQPILTSELLAYCHMARITTESDRRDLLFFINELDLVFLKDAHAKIEKKQEEAKKEAEKSRKKPPRGRSRGRV